jgi:NRPS condensation-like uncharacterized protein
MQTSPVLDVTKEQHGEPIFPLPLAPFERYMLADDRDDYPMAFVIAVDVTGELLRKAFEKALQAALERHPLLTCLVRRAGRRGLYWTPAPGIRPGLDWKEDDSELACPRGERIDLAREPGIRVWVRKQSEQSRITFQFHHSATDGIGGMQFIGDLLASYGMFTAEPGQESPELAPVDVNQLTCRNVTQDSASRFQYVKHAARTFYRLLQAVPLPVAIRQRDRLRTGTDRRFPAFLTRTFSRDVHSELKKLAAGKSVTPNDLLVWTLFRTVGEWNVLQGVKFDNRILRAAIPVSLRTWQHDQTPAANHLSYLFLDQSAETNDDESLQAIHQKTGSIMSEPESAAFVTGIGIGLRVPGLVPAVLKWHPCFASFVMANVGDVKRQFRATFPLKQGRVVAGNIRLEALHGAAPVRRNTRLAVSLGVYAGTLIVNVHCDPRCFNQAESESLTELFADNIRALVNEKLLCRTSHESRK